MRTRSIAALTALSLTAFAAGPALADESGVTLASEQPGYVMDVIIVQAPRLEAPAPAAAEAVTPAWQEPGYVQEVVIVTASRSEVLARARAAALEAARERQSLNPGAASRTLGTPAR